MSYSAKALVKLYRVSPTHIIHVGAWEGMDVPEYLQMDVPKITLIEALPEKATLLRNKYSHEAKVEILEFAASDTSNEIVTFYPLNYGSSSLLKPNIDSLREIFEDFTEMEPITVLTLKLDDLDASANEQILLVIDVQGAELQVLKGSIETLKKTILIKVEVSTAAYYEGQSYQSQIEQFLKSHGFVKVSQRVSKKMGQGDAIFLRKENFNFFQYFSGKISDLRWNVSIQRFNLHLLRRALEITRRK